MLKGLIDLGTPVISRRKFLAAAAGAGALLVAPRGAWPATPGDHEVKAIELDVSCTTEILKPPKGRKIRIWAPVPSDDPDQRVSGFSVEAKSRHRITEDKATGNRMVHIEQERPASGDRIVLRYRVLRMAAVAREERVEKPERHLEPSEWEKWDDNIVRYVDNLTRGETDPVRIGRRFYNAIIDMMTYVHEACGRGVSTLTFEEKTGRCDEFHALFRSMMMYRKIPVVWEQGILLPYPSAMAKHGVTEADCISAHSWVRFHAGGNRWVPVDVSEAKRRPDLREYYFGSLVPNRIRMSSGRGLTLNPPQRGPINTFAYAYGEADGLPLIYGHNYRNVLRFELVRVEA